MTVTSSEIGAYIDSLSDIGTPASGDELLVYDVSAGAAKKVLASEFLSGAGAPAFCGVRVKRTTTFSVPHNASTSVDFDSESYDTDGFHDNSTNKSRLTVPTGKGGYYRIFASASFAAGGSSTALFLLLNGTTTIAGSDFGAASGVDGCQFNIYTEYALAEGDYVELRAYQGSGGARNLTVIDGQPHFGMSLMGA